MSEETKTREKPKIPISEWTVDDVCSWVRSKEYCLKDDCQRFKSEKIDGELLLKLDDADLESIGISRSITRTKYLHDRDQLIKENKEQTNVTKDYIDVLIRCSYLNPKAQYMIGLYYKNDKKDDKEAFRWFKLASEEDHTQSMYYLALYYYNGIGRDKNYPRAFRLFLKAGREGCVNAKYYIAQFYLNGLVSGCKDDFEAFRWFESAAKDGHIEAKFKLGLLYEYGIGCIESISAARKWYKDASELGHSDAEYMLNMLNETEK